MTKKKCLLIRNYLGCFGVSSDHLSCRYHIYWYFTARSYQHPHLVLRHTVIPNFSMYPLQLLVFLYHWNVLIGSYGLWRWELVQRINDEMTGSSQKYVFFVFIRPSLFTRKYLFCVYVLQYIRWIHETVICIFLHETDYFGIHKRPQNAIYYRRGRHPYRDSNPNYSRCADALFASCTYECCVFIEYCII